MMLKKIILILFSLFLLPAYYAAAAVSEIAGCYPETLSLQDNSKIQKGQSSAHTNNDTDDSDIDDSGTSTYSSNQPSLLQHIINASIYVFDTLVGARVNQIWDALGVSNLFISSQYPLCEGSGIESNTPSQSPLCEGSAIESNNSKDGSSLDPEASAADNSGLRRRIHWFLLKTKQKQGSISINSFRGWLANNHIVFNSTEFDLTSHDLILSSSPLTLPSPSLTFIAINSETSGEIAVLISINGGMVTLINILDSRRSEFSTELLDSALEIILNGRSGVIVYLKDLWSC